MKFANSEEFSKVTRAAIEFAKKTGGLLGTEHMIAGMLSVPDSYAGRILKNEGIELKNYINVAVNINGQAVLGYTLSQRMENTLRTANNLVYYYKSGNVLTSDIVLLAIIQDRTSYGVQGLAQLRLNFNNVTNEVSKLIIERGGTIKNTKTETNIASDESKIASEIIKKILESEMESDDDEEEDDSSNDFNSKFSNRREGRRKLDLFERFGQDLTKKAKEGKLDPVIGRKDEVDRIIQVLSRRTKNNPVLIGEPGVGKSAVVEGLAQAIVNDEVPSVLKGKKIFSLDLTSMIAGTKFRGEFEERLDNMIKALKEDQDKILFIDEIHMIVGAGGSGEDRTMDAANILKPALARGELQTIGATTINEYRKFIEKDSALERRFQPIIVEPPTVEDTVVILKGIREKYEKHHSVQITDEALEAAAKLSDRYINDRFLPDKAIDLIDEAASKKHISSCVIPKDISNIEEEIRKATLEKETASKLEEYEKANELKNKIHELEKEVIDKKNKWKEKEKEVKLVLTEEDIAEIISKWTKVPVAKLTQSEAEILLGIENVLRKRVIGQDEAINAISKAVRRARVGIKDPKRPIGSFLFLGPTGVGKTELSKALAEAMFGDENKMIRIDMSEYMDKAAVSKFTGSAPGYVGFEEGGQLTEKVRRNPYSVILFDEIEKAHPDVFNILLQVLEDGRLTDSHGRVVNFKNTIIIMTSNIGAGDIKKGSVGFSESSSIIDYEVMKERQLQAVKNTIKPEIINRIDDIIVFKAFNDDDVKQITRLLVEMLKKRLVDNGIEIEVDDKAIEYIMKKGYDLEYGARPLRRAVQNLIEDELATRMLKNEFAFGDKVAISCEDNMLTFQKI